MVRWLCILLAVALLSSPVRADSWDSQFGLRGFTDDPTDGAIFDLVVIGGDLYAVGGFTTIGGVSAQCIARWNGTGWSNVGGPVFGYTAGDPALTTVAGTPDSLLVVGNFDSVDGSPAEMALWNGSAWTGIHDASLQTQWRYTLESDGGNVFIGQDGGVVRWDGTTFTDISGSVCCTGVAVYDLLWFNGGLVAGGYFGYLGGDAGMHLAFWDGADWSSMLSGEPVLSPGELFAVGDRLYICGAAGGNINTRYLQNGLWHDAVTDNAWCTSAGFMTDAMIFEGALYRTMVCGTTFPGGVAVNGVSKWNGGEWDDMEGGVGTGADAGPLVEYQGNLVVGGSFTAAGGMPAPARLAVWTGDTWLANAPDDRVRAAVTAGDDVFVGGDFLQAFETPAAHVARWDGNAWQALGSGVNGTVHAMIMMGSDLYVGGEFTDAGGSGAAHVAKWNGSAWSAVGLPLNGPVYALATDGTNLYAGGGFLAFHTEPLRRVARWDGASWHAVGEGITGAGSVRALVVDGSNVYAGGDFQYVDFGFVGNTAWWNGTSWATMAFGFDDGTVRALARHGGELYAGGDFVHHGATVVDHIARWNGAFWEALGDAPDPGVDAPVRALVSSGGWLFAAGEFTAAGGSTANRIVSWDGSAWSALGSGVDRPVDALAMGAGELFAGGEFATAGGFGSHRFARWQLTPTAVAAPAARPGAVLEPAVPNPFNPSTRIRYRVAQDARVTIGIYDVTGRRVRSLVDGFVAGSAQTRAVEWNGTDDAGDRVASGVFFVRMIAAGTAQTQKIVLLR